MYKGGYIGKIVRINLTDKSVKKEDLPLEMAKDFIGGAGFGIKFLYDEVPAGVDPLGPENKLIFAPGPLSGTTIPGASRMAVTGKSPLTGGVAVSTSGGEFPAELKFAGFDALIIEGKAEKPTYIWIKNGEVKLQNAEAFWGMKTTDCQQEIKNKLNDQDIRIACIGPAGENLSKIAGIINEMRTAGRKGLGAVMGSKNLKAIAVKGTESFTVASDEKYKIARGEMTKAMKEHHLVYPVFSHKGTSISVEGTCATGIFPAKNFTATGEFEPVEQLGPEMLTTRTVSRYFCYKCPVGCSQIRLAGKGPYSGVLTEGPEFETIYSYGGMTCVDNADAIIAADRLSDEMGIDTMSAGVTIAFAMELYEKGILKKKDTDGLELNFGNHDAMVKLLRKMATREGVGDLFADGVKVAAEKIGKGTDKYAMHVKGLELPGYDVRGAKAHGLNYATAYTGADHNKGYAIQEIFGAQVPYPVDRFSIEKKGKLTKWNQDIHAATADSATMCTFLKDIVLSSATAQYFANFLEAVTGLQYTPEGIEQVGERITNLARAFNVREGFSRDDDTLPKRLSEPLKAGASKGHAISKDDLRQMLDEYYTERGWDVATGIPTREKLVELGLEYVAKGLELN